jgi:hypothetical protein
MCGANHSTARCKSVVANWPITLVDTVADVQKTTGMSYELDDANLVVPIGGWDFHQYLIPAQQDFILGF